MLRWSSLCLASWQMVGFPYPRILMPTNGGNAITSGRDSAPDIPAWTSDGASVNSGIQPEGPSAAGIPEGTQVAYLSADDPSTYQTSDHTIQAGDEFTLQFAGARYSNNATLEASIYLFDGTMRTVMETITLTESDVTNPLSQPGLERLSANRIGRGLRCRRSAAIPWASSSTHKSAFPPLDAVVLWLSSSGISGDFDGNGQSTTARMSMRLSLRLWPGQTRLPSI